MILFGGWRPYVNVSEVDIYKMKSSFVGDDDTVFEADEN